MKTIDKMFNKLKSTISDLMVRIANLEHTNDWVIAFLEKADIGEQDEKERVQLLVRL